ncbi:hypothetical protein CTAYLR_006712 [Chrysophaeum taylorii]|uniref:aspartyl aminopeptidase n=1 Tax=Chrysophaeum taylorii TaxID=2483200 RepID=A0AAD7UD19_9STRA|nr:hypothetical protein CTAYLR_006712 [Chrysophaeum taylorii]
MEEDELVAYLNAAQTPYHAVAECVVRLRAAGFTEVNEKEARWGLQAGGKYFYTRNGSALVAFAVGDKYDTSRSGAVIVGAHTDSPCPRLKPRSSLEKAGHVMLGVAGYGGGLWHTWFDRDLTVGGRAVVRNDKDVLESRLVCIPRPICRIPNLAIHMCSSEERTSFKPNLQNHFPPMLATTIDDSLWRADPKSHHHPLLVRLVAEHLDVEPSAVADFELQLCDTQPATRGGATREFVYSGRLDNLACCAAGVMALIEASQDLTAVGNVMCLALFDHEEVGSQSATGAQGPLLRDTLLRLAADLDTYDVGAAALRARSILISADMAHAHHPNYADRHDPEHAPKLGKGLVIKHNANQRYATNCFGANFIRKCAADADLSPCQEFAVKADMACGSTIGPISAANLGIRTVDVGPPQLSMHSIREMMHVDDFRHTRLLFTHAFKHYHTLASNDFSHLF